MQSVQRSLSLLFQRTLFLIFPLFQKYLNSQVRTKKVVNSAVLQDQAQGYILSYFFRLFRVLSLSRMLVKFSLTCTFHHAWGKCFNSWCSHSWKMHWIYAFSYLCPIPTQNSRQNFWKSCFSKTKGVEKTMFCFINI